MTCILWRESCCDSGSREALFSARRHTQQQAPSRRLIYPIAPHCPGLVLPWTPAVLQEGMVLLRGWLSLAQQAQIVGTIRALGLGPGGFYTPSYSGGGQLSLQMMCLGWHWEPRTSSYEKVQAREGGRGFQHLSAALQVLAALTGAPRTASSQACMPPPVGS